MARVIKAEVEEKVPTKVLDKKDLAAFQAQFASDIMAYANYHGYARVVRDALASVGVHMPVKASINVVIKRDVPEGVTNLDEYGAQVAAEVGGTFDYIKTNL